MHDVHPTPYDEVEYPSYVYGQTHPDRMATIATLHGMNPPQVENCRVLELGCGAGGNLIPLAFDLSHSDFLGIDLAAASIAAGREMIAELDMQNISLRQIDLMALPDDLGEFDYIIAHGLFSWVPEVVRDRILEICRAHLAAQGVVYISYNTYPGCRLREITRDIMRFHTRDATTPAEKVSQSRAVIRWIADAQKQEKSYASFLRDSNANLMKRDDGSIFHDDLADTNVPVYFYEFARQASAHGLQFLSEADHFERTADTISEEAAQQLEELGRENVVSREQYLDFLKGRSFRQTLLCHHEIVLSPRLQPERISGLLIKSEAKPVSANPDIKGRSVEEFRVRNGAGATTDLPLAKATLFYLGGIYPRGARLNELTAQARVLTESSSPDDPETLVELIRKTYEVGVVELHVHEPKYATEVSQRPLASPIARLELRRGNVVSTLLHTSLRLEDELARQMILLLDGRHTRDTLIEELRPRIDEKLIDGVGAHLEDKLRELAGRGLLLA